MAVLLGLGAGSICRLLVLVLVRIRDADQIFVNLVLFGRGLLFAGLGWSRSPAAARGGVPCASRGSDSASSSVASDDSVDSADSENSMPASGSTSSSGGTKGATRLRRSRLRLRRSLLPLPRVRVRRAIDDHPGGGGAACAEGVALRLRTPPWCRALARRFQKLPGWRIPRRGKSPALAPLLPGTLSLVGSLGFLPRLRRRAFLRCVQGVLAGWPLGPPSEPAAGVPWARLPGRQLVDSNRPPGAAGRASWRPRDCAGRGGGGGAGVGSGSATGGVSGTSAPIVDANSPQ